MGNVVSAGLGQAPARQAALRGGLSNDVARAHDQQGVRLGPQGRDARGAGHRDRRHRHRGRRRHGVDEQLPVPADEARAKACAWATARSIDSMIHDGLWDSFHNIHMGLTGEHVSETYRVTREEQDVYAVESHHKAAHATARGLVQGRRSCRSRSRRRRATRSSIDTRRADSRGHDGRGAREAEARVQEGRHRHRRQRAGRERRRVGARRDGRGHRRRSSTSRRSRASSAQATSGLEPKLVHDDAGRGRAESAQEDRAGRSRTSICSS